MPDGKIEGPCISVIVPVHNGGEHFRQCLASLVDAVPRPNSVVIVADGDTDGSAHVAEAFGTRVIKRASPGGPAVARNLGACAVRSSDILLFIDADVSIDKTTIGQVASIFDNDPTIAALIGSYDDTPAESNFYSQFKNLFHHYIHQTAEEEASTFWGACGAIRHEIFRAIGGFDERYRRPSIEDIELGYRLKRAGHRIRLSKELQVKHLKRWQLGSVLKSDFFYRALPWTDLIHRDRRFINDLNMRYSGRFSVLLTYGFVFALIGAFWRPVWFAVAAAYAVGILTLNAPVYRFFLGKRGLWFTLRAIPWHWFYHFYSGLAFAIGTIRHFFFKRAQEVPREAVRAEKR